MAGFGGGLFAAFLCEPPTDPLTPAAFALLGLVLIAIGDPPKGKP